MKKLIIPLKLLLSFACLYYAFQKIDFHLTKGLLYSTTGISALIVGTVAMYLQILFATLRLKLLTKTFPHPISFRESLRISLMGSFFSQMALSFVSGDAVRIWSLKQSLKTVKLATFTVVIDRCLGLFALSFLFLCALPFLSHIPTLENYKLFIIFGSMLAGCAMLLFWYFIKTQRTSWIVELIALIKKIFLHTYQTTSMLGMCSLLIHLCNVLVVYATLIAFEIPISFTQCFIVMVPIMFAMMFPLSIGGWGIREGAMLTGFSMVHCPPEPVLAASILLGLSLLIASIPGFFLFLTRKNRLPELSKKINSTNTKDVCAIIS
jgi:uncharacterized membrane protein YbhN (UPF0104 family)